MNIGKTLNALFLAAMVFVASCAPTLREFGRERGCQAAEEYSNIYVEKEIRRERFKNDLPYRAALLPISLTVGFLFNYVSQLEFIVPLLAPTGYTLKGGDFKALYLSEAASYSPLNGTRLDELDDSVIARANFDIALCYYESGNYAQASAFLEDLAGSRYGNFIGKDNLFFLLGDCYYMLGMYDASIYNYRMFLEYSAYDDDRNEVAKRQIKTIDALNKKGLWGIEEEGEDR